MAREIINDDGDRVIMDETTYVSYYSPFARFIWTILGIINALLSIRFLLHMFGANPQAGFTDFMYTLTQPLVAPFVGVLRSTAIGTGTLEWFTIIAMAVYWLIAWALARLFTTTQPLARF